MSVIAGNNGCGKTTVLEALRLLFVFATPRNNVDLRQAASQIPGLQYRNNNSIDGSALLGEPGNSCDVVATCELSDTEVNKILGASDTIALHQYSLMYGGPQGVAARLQTTEGMKEWNSVRGQVRDKIESEFCNDSKDLRLHITIEGTTGQLSRRSELAGSLLANLWEQPDYNLTPVSYFPADRAIPQAAVNIQFGQAEYQSHINTHLVQAHQKYARLKQYITNRHLVRGSDIADDINQVLRIFLGGRRVFDGVSVEPVSGRLMVTVKDIDTNRSYDIGDMSSGERGVLLTYLLLRRSMMKGGIVLLDEPELHFHPTLQKKIVPFLAEHVCASQDVQVIMCTHSPQVLSSAYFEESAVLHHMHARPQRVTEIRRSDRAEAESAIAGLGADPIATICHEGVLYLEGKTDKAVVEEAFLELVGGYKVQVMHGRSEAEKYIRELKAGDVKGQVSIDHVFVLDNDRSVFSFEDSEHVRVAQLRRYCIENYLLDHNVIYSVYDAERRKAETTKRFRQLKSPPDRLTRGDVLQIVKDAALRQLPFVVAKKVYSSSFSPPNCGFLNEYEEFGGDFDGVSDRIWERLEGVRSFVEGVSSDGSKKAFAARCVAELNSAKSDVDYMVELDGKKTLATLWELLISRPDFGLSKNAFMERLVTESVREDGDIWKELKNDLKRLMKRDETSE